MNGNGEEEIAANEAPKLRDRNTGELISIDAPEAFHLQTLLIDTAYYVYRGREYRFLLCQAREAGLMIDFEKAA